MVKRSIQISTSDIPKVAKVLVKRHLHETGLSRLLWYGSFRIIYPSSLSNYGAKGGQLGSRSIDYT